MWPPTIQKVIHTLFAQFNLAKKFFEIQGLIIIGLRSQSWTLKTKIRFLRTLYFD